MFTLPNEPNCTVKFNFGPDFECFPEDFIERPIPKPMIDVPYHGFDNRVENGESNEKKPQKEWRGLHLLLIIKSDSLMIGLVV